MKKLLFIFIILMFVPSVYAWDWPGYDSQEVFNITNGCFGCVVYINTLYNNSDRWVNNSDNKELAHWHDEMNASFVYINLTANGSYQISKFVQYANTNATRSDGNATFAFFDNFTINGDFHQWIITGSVMWRDPGQARITGTNSWNANGMLTQRMFDRHTIIEFDDNVSDNTIDVQYGYQPDLNVNTGVNFYKNNPNEIFDYLGSSQGFKTYNTNWDLETIWINNTGYNWRVNKTFFAKLDGGTETGYHIGATVYSVNKYFRWDNVRAYNASSINTTIKFNNTILNTIPSPEVFHVPEPLNNCSINIITNLTNLAPTVHPTIPGTGERTNGTLYWTNSSPIQIWLISHGNTVAQTADIILKINNTIVQHTSGRPLGAAEENWKTISTIIPKGSNYSVEFYNFHHYEWRESKIDLKIDGCNYPDNNDSLNSIILIISIITAFLTGLICSCAVVKKTFESHVREYHQINNVKKNPPNFKGKRNKQNKKKQGR